MYPISLISDLRFLLKETPRTSSGSRTQEKLPKEREAATRMHSLGGHSFS